SEVTFQFKNAAPAWVAAIGQILVPFSIQSTGDTPDTFDIASAESQLCPLSGSAKFDMSNGWLLPAAKVDPQQLGHAAGTGALCSEAVFCFCGHKASLDRPVDANGSPFRIESTIALAAILQNGPDFQALLLDNDLLFDGNPNTAGAFERHSLALRNAFFSISRPYSLFLFGKLENGNEITKGIV